MGTFLQHCQLLALMLYFSFYYNNKAFLKELALSNLYFHPCDNPMGRDIDGV